MDEYHDDITQLLRLSMFDLSDKEAAAADLRCAVEFCEGVKNIPNQDSEKIEPHETPHKLRSDTAVSEFSPDELLSNAPERQDSYFVLPRRRV